jgi:hypothetical protein
MPASVPAAIGGVVSINNKLGKVLLLGAFWFALVGAPMSPQEIEELLRQVNVPEVAHTRREQSDSGDRRTTKFLRS